MTTATSNVGKQQLIDKGFIKSDDNKVVGLMISEEEIIKKRNKMKGKEELEQQNANDEKLNQFDAIQEENEDEAQRDEESKSKGDPT